MSGKFIRFLASFLKAKAFKEGKKLLNDLKEFEHNIEKKKNKDKSVGREKIFMRELELNI